MLSRLSLRHLPSRSLRTLPINAASRWRCLQTSPAWRDLQNHDAHQSYEAKYLEKLQKAAKE